ncbi:MAG: hypothetical protein CO113_01855 [Elusimicrobia bacterium CG_4_9_14_3_um_filter_62_55]|nr:MAG: hypothetical protein COR54_10915 [Elusimicrobia bacterium CG22_combo_CG10-13_8_21_14_all_63_91]PJA18342.1 MAG: hypothetical protein COX66_01500 [Elusimicrobia bacterium CG_4_10_14_0_2_um_filter_63_34]PJB26757.1 MAG: hypothetical protein CO113_01855 [Elusimicrobia bacterium CG_4_9_14_3_um_filter_62_55]
MKRITISLILLAANGLGTAEANGADIPSEVREALRSLPLPEVKALKAVEKAMTRAGKALEGMVPVPDLTVDLKGRRLSKHLAGSSLGGHGRFDLDADYALGGSPAAKISLRAHGASLNASYASNGTLSTAISLPLGTRQNLQYTLSRAAHVDHRVSWNFSLPL